MAPQLIEVETDAALPRRADVVIIGGGIAGVSTLLALAEAGISAVLVEKGRLAGEQSSRNWGFCRTQGRDQAEVPLALESLRQWDRMDQRVGGDVGFTRAGACYLCETPGRDLGLRGMAGKSPPMAGAKPHPLGRMRLTPSRPDQAAAGPAPSTPRTMAGRNHNARCR